MGNSVRVVLFLTPELFGMPFNLIVYGFHRLEYSLKKGLRIYAMYPHTTSLYVATVVDNTTYCRGDDDIIVVEFDEDERGKQA